jgi:predicted DNA-binding protein (MmcQ/YjbR family)
MRFNAPKCDDEIREQMREQHKILDTVHVEQSNWPVRSPNKEKNLGRAQL